MILNYEDTCYFYTNEYWWLLHGLSEYTLTFAIMVQHKYSDV